MAEGQANPDATAEAAAVDPGYAFAERVRTVTFKQARRGYDRREVDEFLARLADDLRSAELEPAAPGDRDPDALRRELERVGESTASILRAAEQTARELRGGAQRDAEEVRQSAAADAARLAGEAEEAATSLREAAEEEVRRLRLEASARAEEAIRSAQGRAESLVADAVQRRRLLEARIERLLERREALLEEVERLASELRDVASGEREEELLSPRGVGEDEAAEGELGEDDLLEDLEDLEEPGEPGEPGEDDLEEDLEEGADLDELPADELGVPDEQTQEFPAFGEEPVGEPTDEHER
jgi:DivIVA domain-containing protein